VIEEASEINHRRSHRSLIWIAAETGTNAILLLGTMLLMARLIGPTALGAAVLATGVIQLVNIFVEYLFHDALILHDKIDDDIFNQSFFIVQTIAFSVTLVALLLPLIVPEDITHLAWLGFGAACSLPFSGALGIANARLRRAFRYQDVARASIGGRIGGALIGLLAAFLGYGAWSLVAQFTSSVAVHCLAIYVAMEWRPKFRMTGGVEHLLRYALPNAAMNLLIAMRLQGFLIVSATLLGVTEVGFINAGFRIVNTPQAILSNALASFLLPLLSHSRQSFAAFRSNIRLGNRVALTATIPIFAGLVVSADDLVPLALGKEWVPTIQVVQILALGSLASAARFPSSLILRSQGIVKYSFYNALFQLIATLGAALIFRPATPIGASLCWTAPIAVPLAITIWIVRRETNLSVRDQLDGLTSVLLATFGMMAIVVGSTTMFALNDSFSRLFFHIGLGAIAFPILLIAIDATTRQYLTARLRRLTVGR
jgi:O-antigen/teichoic acid export membrane protein